jgi:hypothetical protein
MMADAPLLTSEKASAHVHYDEQSSEEDQQANNSNDHQQTLVKTNVSPRRL